MERLKGHGKSLNVIVLLIFLFTLKTAPVVYMFSVPLYTLDLWLIPCGVTLTAEQIPDPRLRNASQGSRDVLTALDLELFFFASSVPGSKDAKSRRSREPFPGYSMTRS